MLRKIIELQLGENRLILKGLAGDVEAVFLKPEQMRIDVVAVVCHPHPLQEGTMNNKVVTTVARTFKDLNIASLRFNFRGVGASEGEFDYGVGETQDLLALLKWLSEELNDPAIILAGFSFGSYVAYRASSQFPVDFLICIAPAVNHVDYETLPPPHCPWLVIQGEADEIVPAEMVFSFVEHCKVKPQLIRMPHVSHFFHGALIELKQQLSTVLSQELSSIISKHA